MLVCMLGCSQVTHRAEHLLSIIHNALSSWQWSGRPNQLLFHPESQRSITNTHPPNEYAFVAMASRLQVFQRHRSHADEPNLTPGSRAAASAPTGGGNQGSPRVSIVWKQPRSSAVNTRGKTKWTARKTMQEEEEEEESSAADGSALKISSCVSRTIGRVWWELRTAVIVRGGGCYRGNETALTRGEIAARCRDQGPGTRWSLKVGRAPSPCSVFLSSSCPINSYSRDVHGKHVYRLESMKTNMEIWTVKAIKTLGNNLSNLDVRSQNGDLWCVCCSLGCVLFVPMWQWQQVGGKEETPRLNAKI